MDVKEINTYLLESHASHEISSAFPNIQLLEQLPLKFEREIGLEKIPAASGVILIRGARQLGKSTWLESQLVKSQLTFGPGSTFYLNGDYLNSREDLENEIINLLPLYSAKLAGTSPRLFIDEITAVAGWEVILKRLYDSGKTRNLLILTTGSQARDLRRGKERLPGRKGKLNRTEYYFPPLSFREFSAKATPLFGKNTLLAYLLTGGSPLAANELAQTGQIPEFVYSLTLEWLLGECARVGRSRNTLTWLLQTLWKIGPNPVSVNQLARDVGAANNTVIQGYIDLLIDCLALGVALPWDISHGRPIPRKAAKYPWINILSAWCFLPGRPTNFRDYERLPQTTKGYIWESLVAQELWRRRALIGNPTPELLGTYTASNGSVDFVSDHPDLLVEVKSGRANPQEFVWFTQAFPKKKLLVVSQSSFVIKNVQGVTFEEFLRMG